MSSKHRVFSVALLTLATMACASKKESDSPLIAFDVAFPSTQAAAVTENVKVFAFSGHTCPELVKLRQTGQALPAATAETGLLTPCQLFGNSDNQFDLPLNADYALFAVGQVAAQDVFIGCTEQTRYGSQRALPIELTFINNRQKLRDTNCTKLSDRCAVPARCQ